jgi:hypothetical protein
MLYFCEFTSKRPVEIDPMAVVRLTPGCRKVARNSFVENVNVLTVTLNDGARYTLFDTAGQVAKRIIRERAVATGRLIGDL